MAGFDDAAKRPLGESMSAARRACISWAFEHIYGAAPEAEWHGRDKVLPGTMARLIIPAGPHNSAARVLKDVQPVGSGDGSEGSLLGARRWPAKMLLCSPL